MYDTETGNLHLVRECDRKLVKIAVCNSRSNHHEVERELSCLQDEQERYELRSTTQDLTDLMEPQSAITVIEPKPVKHFKKNYKKLSVTNKKYSKIPKFDIMEDDELMQGDEPKEEVTVSSTETTSVVVEPASHTSEPSILTSTSESSESYETTIEDAKDTTDFTEVRTRRETVPAESSTMAMSTGGTMKKYSNHAKSDFNKHELNLSGKSLGKANPQIYSPQVMRKEFPRPEVSNITSKKSDNNQLTTGDMFVPPLLMVKSHFPHHTKEYEPILTSEMPHITVEVAFNETFENETSTEEFLDNITHTTAPDVAITVSGHNNTAVSDSVSSAPTTSLATTLTQENIEEVSQTLDGTAHEIEKKDHNRAKMEFAHDMHEESEKSVKKQLSTQNITHETHETFSHPVIIHEDPLPTETAETTHKLDTSSPKYASSVTPIHHEPSSAENQLDEHHESSLNNAEYNPDDFRPNRHRVLTPSPANNYMTRVLG